MKRENVVYVELNLVKMNKGNELKLPITKKNLELLENQVYSIKSGFKQHKITQRDSWSSNEKKTDVTGGHPAEPKWIGKQG